LVGLQEFRQVSYAADAAIHPPGFEFLQATLWRQTGGLEFITLLLKKLPERSRQRFMQLRFRFKSDFEDHGFGVWRRGVKGERPGQNSE
jgi:hypothetical protein